MQEKIARLIADIKMGMPITPEAIVAVREVYAPFHETEPYDEIGVFRDQAYGKHERQRLDVFAPDGIAEPRPVVIFVHGGGFVGGDRRTAGTPYYDNVGVWAARNGFVGVTMSYRLAPQFKFPAGPDDVAGAVAWVRENIAAHGGDPTAIVLLGQSAGASHVAAYGARADRDERVRAIAMMSGIYDFAPFESAPNDLVPITGRRRSPAKIVAVAGSFDLRAPTKQVPPAAARAARMSASSIPRRSTNRRTCSRKRSTIAMAAARTSCICRGTTTSHRSRTSTRRASKTNCSPTASPSSCACTRPPPFPRSSMRRAAALATIAAAGACAALPARADVPAGDPVRLALNSETYSNLPLFLAIDNGYFEAQHLDVTVVPYTGSVAHAIAVSGARRDRHYRDRAGAPPPTPVLHARGGGGVCSPRQRGFQRQDHGVGQRRASRLERNRVDDGAARSLGCEDDSEAGRYVARHARRRRGRRFAQRRVGARETIRLAGLHAGRPGSSPPTCARRRAGSASLQATTRIDVQVTTRTVRDRGSNAKGSPTSGSRTPTARPGFRICISAHRRASRTIATT